jgi:hypothetical protein
MRERRIPKLFLIILFFSFFIFYLWSSCSVKESFTPKINQYYNKNKRELHKIKEKFVSSTTEYFSRTMRKCGLY